MHVRTLAVMASELCLMTSEAAAADADAVCELASGVALVAAVCLLILSSAVLIAKNSPNSQDDDSARAEIRRIHPNNEHAYSLYMDMRCFI